MIICATLISFWTYYFYCGVVEYATTGQVNYEHKGAKLMILLMYHSEQDTFRYYMCECECWEDMIHMFPPLRYASLTMLIEYGWEVIGEL